MRIFTLIVYILLGLLLAGFATMNFERVTMWLPFGYEANWPFAVYIIVALILGALPVSIMHSLSRWRWKRRVRKLEAQLAEAATSEPVVAGSSAATGMAPHRADEPVPPLPSL
ncbi:MAG: lipopolysaccharide assembly protein LapA domain-containing protein [Pacificimonas sp.]